MYAEDDLPLAELNTAYLKYKKYEVVHVADGDAAWKTYCEWRPDIVLLDIIMPGKSGLEVARMIREEDRITPIVFVTSLGRLPDVGTGLDMGALDYLRKEQLFSEVEIRIRKILERSIISNGIIRITKNSFLHVGAHRLVVCGDVFNLSLREYTLLIALLNDRNTMVERESLIAKMWSETGTDNYLSKVIGALRKYFRNDPEVEIISYNKVGVTLALCFPVLQKREPEIAGPV